MVAFTEKCLNNEHFFQISLVEFSGICWLREQPSQESRACTVIESGTVRTMFGGLCVLFAFLLAGSGDMATNVV